MSVRYRVILSACKLRTVHKENNLSIRAQSNNIPTPFIEASWKFSNSDKSRTAGLRNDLSENRSQLHVSLDIRHVNLEGHSSQRV